MSAVKFKTKCIVTNGSIETVFDSHHSDIPVTNSLNTAAMLVNQLSNASRVTIGLTVEIVFIFLVFI